VNSACFVVGARPNFMKAAPVYRALRELDETLELLLVHTGQHYDDEMSRVFFEELGLGSPDYSLDLHTADTDAMTPGIVAALERERPDWVLVYGDTNSTLAGARAGIEAGVPVAHVEAGLRSGDWSMPEEHNRVEIDRISELLLCPDDRSRDTLEREGVPGRIEVVGDVMADAALRLAPIARERSDVLRSLGLEPAGYVVATVHREANVRPERLARILEGLGRVKEPVVLPAHPRTRATIERERLPVDGRIVLSPPLGYLDLAALASQARVIATDSGGLQKEAYWYGVPCVTMRPSTEWVDTVEVGANRLVDDDPDAIAHAVAEARMPDARPPLYGDGRASERIAAILATAP
jgi:UDP-GlcNAc3NAcA epimerase